MRQMAENIARRANKEDGVADRLWQGRFRSVPLLDETALLACAAYVDLNPVRASMAETLEQSDFTSLQDRIASEKASRAKRPRRRSRKGRKRMRELQRRDGWLAPVYTNPRGGPGPQASRSGRRASDKGFLPIHLPAYLELVDWTGRQLARGKRGRIPDRCAPILERLGLSRETWCELAGNFGRLFRRVAGRPASLAASAERGGVSQRRSSGGAALLAGT